MARLPAWLVLTALLCTSGAQAEDPAKDLVRVPAAAPTPPRAPAASPATRWAVLIGVDEYQDRSIADLRFSANDARSLAALLVESGAYPADHVVLLTPDQADPTLRPTRVNILRLLAWAKALRSADTLLFFFSGHGGSVDGSDTSLNLLYPSDAVLTLPADTGIDLGRVFGLLEQADVQRRVVILDACRSRFANAKAAVAPSWEAAPYRLSKGTMVLYSTQPGGYSYEDEGAKLGALTQALLDGLHGAADGQLDPADGVVGMNELYEFATQRLRLRGSRTGQVQIPARGGEWTGADFALAPVTTSPAAHPAAVATATLPKVPWVALQDRAPLSFLSLPGGVFQRGGERGFEHDDERPARQILLSPFYMAETELTRRQWRAVMGLGPSNWVGTDTADHPAVASWCAALRFANELSARERDRGLAPVYQVPEDCEHTGKASWDRKLRGYRLPTEAEWEYAARAGTTTRYFFGDDSPLLCTFANVRDLTIKDGFDAGRFVDCRDGFWKPSAVRRFEANPFGLYDVYGNEDEWVWDRYDGAAYELPEWRDPTGPERATSGGVPVLRGGAAEGVPESARSGARDLALPNTEHGFRLALDSPEAPQDVDSTRAAAFAAEHRARATRVAAQLRWVTIPAGEGVAGDTRSGQGPVVNIVFTEPFEMLATEVSNAMYTTLYPWHVPVDELPVVKVGWDRAEAFCRAQGGRLPTELEWEYAARAGSRTDWPAGYDRDSLRAHEQGQWNRVAVGQLPPNAWGLHDMLCNAPEWVSDHWWSGAIEHLAAEPQPLVDPPRIAWTHSAEHGTRTFKGLCESNPQPHTGARAGASPEADGSTVVGFRCVRGPERADLSLD